MLKRLRTAHPILYCILAEVLFLGSLFLSSLVLTVALVAAGADFSGLDEYLLSLVQELVGAGAAWLLLRRTGRQGLLGRRGSGFWNGLLVGMYPLAFICYSIYSALIFERPDTPLLPAGRILSFLACMAMVGVAEEFLFRGVIAETLLEHFGTSRAGVWKACLLSGVLFGALTIALSGAFPHIYNTSYEVRRLATRLILIAALFMPFDALANAAYFILRSGGQTYITFLFDSGFVWVVMVPLAFVLSRFAHMAIIPLYLICQSTNMLKGGLTYCNMITTVSNTYAGEIQTPEYGETLDAHLRYHSGKLRGIVNGIDYDIWNPWTDPMLHTNYDITNVLPRKKENKRALQEELGLWQDDHKFVIGLISRLTNQKGLDLVNAILPQIMDEHTQVVVLGTGDKGYEDAFRYYENAYRGNLCANIMYDEGRAHRIYAGADALLVPSKFEPCGLTQLIGMHYGTIPIVRETGGLKDTVQPHNEFTHDGNGFTFDRYDPGLLLDAINRAKTFYFTNRYCWDEMVQRDMDKNVSWENSAWQYRNLYLELTADRG